MSQANRTRRPDPLDQNYVAQLINEKGIVKAARQLGLSRLAALNVAHGGDCYGSTLEHVRVARLENAAP